jgi:hypothetical protein
MALLDSSYSNMSVTRISLPCLFIFLFFLISFLQYTSFQSYSSPPPSPLSSLITFMHFIYSPMFLSTHSLPPLSYVPLHSFSSSSLLCSSPLILFLLSPMFLLIRMALRTRVKAIVMFAGVIKHRLNRTNTANILARLEDTMS